MTTQTEETYQQTEAFPKPPKTRRELAEEFLEHFQADVEKAETALGNARRKLREAIVLRDDAEENLRRAIMDVDDAVEGEGEEEPDDSTMQLPAPVAALESGGDAEDAEWSEDVDPFTGEVKDSGDPEDEAA